MRLEYKGFVFRYSKLTVTVAAVAGTLLLFINYYYVSFHAAGIYRVPFRTTSQIVDKSFGHILFSRFISVIKIYPWAHLQMGRARARSTQIKWENENSIKFDINSYGNLRGSNFSFSIQLFSIQVVVVAGTLCEACELIKSPPFFIAHGYVLAC